MNDEIYADMDRMFNSAGWSHLAQGFKDELEALPMMAFTNAKSMEDLERYRIRFELLSQLLGLPEDMRAEREQVEDDEPNV